MSTYFYSLAFLPILLLIAVSLWKGVHSGIYSSLVVTTILFFSWNATFLSYAASFISALIDTLSIITIVAGAIILYQTMEQKGYIAGIENSLSNLHPNNSFRFYFLSFFLTAFFESVAGFGTPGTVVPILLISMGYPALASISTVLLLDGFFAMAGALGTPVFAGLQVPLKLEDSQLGIIYLLSAIMLVCAGIVVMFFIASTYKKEIGKEGGGFGFILFAAMMVPFLLMAYPMQELTGLLSSILFVVLMFLFFIKNKKIHWRPWLPYGILVALLLLPKIIPLLKPILAYTIAFDSLFGTNIDANFQPLKLPFIPFIFAAFVALYQSGNYRLDLKPIFSKTSTVTIILFPSMLITQLMLNSGNGGDPSMIDVLSMVFSKAGGVYPLLSPFIGALGAFISGSTTLSNIIFGPIQFNAAKSLSLPESLTLSLQLAGASLGNAICLFNLIAASAVAGITDYNKVLKKTIWPTLAALIVCALIGFFLSLVM